ncbi:hypothetical protein SAMN07250955_1064 [Arboricoccus pini]|uniref:Membrane-bound lysozyme-inhibitor of c-type lysozyme n=1 Tax=Arboricoccus pini TaxID=1963835 RepID=A0A212R623_9PROT|nr:hypothetical protein [Arboricoccus pini]SNB67616.1 hypothetical protein SAMN07250955_1064 [Arboricoccus pini]
MTRWLRRIAPLGLLLLAACHRGQDSAGPQIVHAGTPTAGVTGHAVDYRCEEDKTLRITFVGDRAVVDTGYDRYSLRATGPGEDTYLQDGHADSEIHLEADGSKAHLTLKDGVAFKNCVAQS